MKSTLTKLFSPDDLSDVTSGIRKFVRALGAEVESFQFMRQADELELVFALEMVPVYVEDTTYLLGKTPSKNAAPYIEEVKKDMEEWLLTGPNEKQTVVMRNRNLTMYHMVIEPTINLIGKLDHKQAVDSVEAIVNEVIQLIQNSEDYGDHYDGLIAREQIAGMVRARAAARKIELAKKRPSKRKYKVNELETLGEDELVDVLSEGMAELIFE